MTLTLFSPVAVLETARCEHSTKCNFTCKKCYKCFQTIYGYLADKRKATQNYKTFCELYKRSKNQEKYEHMAKLIYVYSLLCHCAGGEGSTINAIMSTIYNDVKRQLFIITEVNKNLYPLLTGNDIRINEQLFFDKIGIDEAHKLTDKDKGIAQTDGKGNYYFTESFKNSIKYFKGIPLANSCFSSSFFIMGTNYYMNTFLCSGHTEFTNIKPIEGNPLLAFNISIDGQNNKGDIIGKGISSLTEYPQNIKNPNAHNLVDITDDLATIELPVNSAFNISIPNRIVKKVDDFDIPSDDDDFDIPSDDDDEDEDMKPDDMQYSRPTEEEMADLLGDEIKAINIKTEKPQFDEYDSDSDSDSGPDEQPTKEEDEDENIYNHMNNE